MTGQTGRKRKEAKMHRRERHKAKQTMICNAVRYVSFQVPGRQRVYKRAVQQRTVTSADGQIVTMEGE